MATKRPTKKVTAKKTTRKKEAPAPEAVPTPTPEEFVNMALGFVKEAESKFEVSCHHLNDGRLFFAGMDPVLRAEWISNINKYIEQAQFGLSSVRDELKIALDQKRETKTKAFLLAPPATPQNIPAPESAVNLTAEDSLRKTLSLIGFALQTMSSHEFPGVQSKVVGETITLLDGIRKKVAADIDSLKPEVAA